MRYPPATAHLYPIHITRNILPTAPRGLNDTPESLLQLPLEHGNLPRHIPVSHVHISHLNPYFLRIRDFDPFPILNMARSDYLPPASRSSDGNVYELEDWLYISLTHCISAGISEAYFLIACRELAMEIMRGRVDIRGIPCVFVWDQPTLAERPLSEQGSNTRAARVAVAAAPNAIPIPMPPGPLTDSRRRAMRALTSTAQEELRTLMSRLHQRLDREEEEHIMRQVQRIAARLEAMTVVVEEDARRRRIRFIWGEEKLDLDMMMESWKRGWV